MLTIEFTWVSSISSVADVDLLIAGAELHFDDSSSLLLDALLFSKPAVVGDPLGEEGVL